MKFPKILAAARQIEIDQWALGDALIEECGDPAPRAARTNANDGSYALLEEASEFLARHGLDYSVGYLAKMRQTAFDFRGRNRKENLSWSAHNEAKTPANLRAVIAKDPEPTRDFIRNEVREMEGRQRLPRREELQPESGTGSFRSNLEPTLSHECNALKDRVEEIEARLGEFNVAYIDAVAEQLMDIAEFSRKASVRLKKSGGRGAHLNVVTGGAA